MSLKLYAPKSYWDADPEIRKTVSNGCGTSGWKGWIVPETMYGLRITEACDIHDWMYAIGETMADKKEADRVFLNNLVRIIEHKGGWLEGLRKRRAKEYFIAVDCFGGPAFWEEKNSIITYRLAMNPV